MGPEEMRRLREELAQASVLAWHRQLVAAWGGNLSVRVPGSDLLLITPTGLALVDVTPETILTVNLRGEVVEAPEGLRPSKEMGMHLLVYNLRPGAGAVAHLHPPHATAFSTKRLPLPLVADGAKTALKMVPCLGWAPSGSEPLHRIVEEGLREHPQARAFLLKNHGLLTFGPDLKSALYLADLVEATAKIALLSRLVDEAPYPVVPDVVG